MNTFIRNLALALSFAALAGCTPRYANNAERVVAEFNNPSSRYVIVVAHRGDWRHYPENSLAAIESVIRMGADMVELDVKMTRDSVLVLSHDKTVDRTTTGKGLISEMTLDSLRKFNLRYAHGIRSPYDRMPTLKEALEVCKDRIMVNVDQGYDYYDQVLAITEELGVTGQVLIKGKRPMEEVEAVLAAHPRNMMYMPITEVWKESGAELFEQYMSSGSAPVAYEMSFPELDAEAYEYCRRVIDSGSKVWMNTLWPEICGGCDDRKAYDDPSPDAAYGALLDLGSSIIQTDRPALLIKYLKKKGRR